MVFGALPQGDRVALGEAAVTETTGGVRGDPVQGADTRMWTSLAPASRSSSTIWRQVVPRTMESSIMTTRLSSTVARRGLSLTRTACSRLSWGVMVVCGCHYIRFFAPVQV